MIAVSNWVTLWSTTHGLSCSFFRNDWKPPFAVMVSRGPDLLTLMTFASEEDAIGFVLDAVAVAAAEMHAGRTFDAAVVDAWLRL